MVNKPSFIIYSLIKRFFDVLLSLMFMFIFSFFFLIISLSIKIESRGSIIYWSDRVGKNKKIFKMPKFRSMYVGSPELATHLMSNPEKTITRVGNILRKYSLDELPQLWSIFKGNMSFVGPRPALFNQDDLIQLRDEFYVNNLIPGLTGWAQINGRDNLSIREKVKHDADYLKRASLLFDAYIILRTFTKVFRRLGVRH
jgi:O-antigen biosynthesis protein WbqP